MIIKEKVNADYETSNMFSFEITTDSSIERDIIKKHLCNANCEYQSLVRGQTKGLPLAEVVYAARVDSDHSFKKSKEQYHSIFCKCDMLIFFNTPASGWYKVKCPNPNCNYEQNVLINKGETKYG